MRRRLLENISSSKSRDSVMFMRFDGVRQGSVTSLIQRSSCAGYSWPHYEGSHTVGSICVDFDERINGAMRVGQGRDLARGLTSGDVLANGGIEFRQWIVMLGAIGGAKPATLVYDPFFRGVMA